MIQLEANGVAFYSKADEAVFFEWLSKIPSVTKIEGVGFSIIIHVDEQKTDEVDLRELLSIFRRYSVSMNQLSAFNDESFADWFRDKNAYWYESVFEDYLNS
jgi:hypothetical protein